MATDTIVFLGPTLGRDEAESILDATYLPPVEQGAVLRAVAARPRRIAIIDGYFSWVPSVWHKEILWALDRGIEVHGASSMGALRAAELTDYGMSGHGTVFRDFKSGRLEDDDEVAIVHADADAGFRPLSDAMVNIRYTLSDAAGAGVLGADAADALVALAKRQVYYDRKWSQLLSAARQEELLSTEESEHLSDWLIANARDVKREDAVALLQHLSTSEAGRSASDGPIFEFQATLTWHQLTASVQAHPIADPLTNDATTEDILRECRVAGDWPTLEPMALARLLVTNPSPVIQTVTEQEYVAALARLCLDLELNSLDELSTWTRATALEPNRLTELVEREALLQRARKRFAGDLPQAIMEVLLVTGRLPKLAERAKRTGHTQDQSFGPNEERDVIARFRESVPGPKNESDESLARRHGWACAADMTDDLVGYSLRTNAAGSS